MLENALNEQHYPKSTLYVVATPLGNITDISIRAMHVLKLVDYIACEDTRHSGQLLKTYGIHNENKMISCHMHNEHEASQLIIKHLGDGARIAYISDAGTPAISDPGSILVQNVLNAKYLVTPIGGISAPTSLLSVAGDLFTDIKNASPAYCFAGFLPVATMAKNQYLKLLADYQMPVVFFESPKRIKQTIKDIVNMDGNIFHGRKLIIGREISKQFEQILHIIIDENTLSDNSILNLVERGEFCIAISSMPTNIGQNKGQEHEQDQAFSPQYQIAKKLLQHLVPLIGTKQASGIVANSLDLPAKVLYNVANKIKSLS
jgi:16S rRNA (cytidine1402-2'-O)-methyltransferase